MAQDSWPSPNHNTRNVTDAEYEHIAEMFSGNGVYGDPTSADVVTAGSGLQVLVKANNEASVRGHYWTSGTSDVALTISANSSGSTRVDRVVLRLDRSTWDVRAVVREGTSGAGAPDLVQQTGEVGVYEILLADVTVVNNAVSVSVNNRPQFVGSRVRAENQGAANPNPALGEIGYRPNTGLYRGYVGSGTYVTLYEDTGDQTVSIGFSDVWESSGPMVGRMRTGVVSVQVNVKRKSITFQDDDDDGSYIALVPASLRPVRTEYFAGYFTNDTACRVEVRTNGEVWVTHPQNDVPINNTLRLTMTWLKP